MKYAIWALVIITLMFAAAVFVIAAKNKELDRLSDKLRQTAKLNRTLCESIEQQVCTINELEASVKFYKDAYFASEEVRRKLVAERGGNG